MILEVVLQVALSPEAIAYIVAAVGVIGALSVYGVMQLDRRWAAYVAFLFELVLTVLFAYTVNIVYALYGAPGFGSVKDIALGVAYQRVAAGILSAMLLLAGVVSIGYYIELQKTGGGGHE